MGDFDRFEALSFDCYGTLIDWETGIASFLGSWAARVGLDLGRSHLLAAHAAHETHVQQEMPSASYPDVLAETLRRVGQEWGVEVSDRDAAAYGGSVGEWPAFADSGPALARLGERFTLIILSNVDRASFARSNARLDVTFDLIVTSEDVGSYKPDTANFEYMFALLSEVGVQRSHLLHVAESLYHDHEPAQQLGLESVWIDRRHDKEGSGATATPTRAVTPRWSFHSMDEFARVAAPE